MTAACITNPLDVIKVRMQLEGELSQRSAGERKYNGFVRGGYRMVKSEGFFALYRGLSASLMREGSYSTIRLGAYEPFKRVLGATDPSQTPLWKKVVAGACSGSIGSAIANPTDLVKIRMQASGEPGLPPRYSSAFSAFGEIYSSEGWRGLYRGVGPTTQRAALLTAAQIPSYDHTKHFILNAGYLEEGLVLHFVSAFTAGLVTAVVTSPIDVIKTRVMNQPLKATGEGMLYAGAMDCLVKSVRAEGWKCLYKGLIPNWVRIGPHTTVSLLVFEKLRALLGYSAV